MFITKEAHLCRFLMTSLFHEKAAGTERWSASIMLMEKRRALWLTDSSGSQHIWEVKACYGVWFGDDGNDKKTAEDV